MVLPRCNPSSGAWGSKTRILAGRDFEPGQQPWHPVRLDQHALVTHVRSDRGPMPIILIRAVKEAPALAGRLQAYRTAELAVAFLPSEIIGSGERILAWRLGQVRLGAASAAGQRDDFGILAFADRFRCHSGYLLFCRWESPAPGAHASNPGAGCLPGTGEHGQVRAHLLSSRLAEVHLAGYPAVPATSRR